MHDGHANIYVLKFKGCNLTLAPPSARPLKFKPGKECEKILYMSKHEWGEPLVRPGLYFSYFWLNQTQVMKWNLYTLLLNHSWESLR